MTDEEKPTKTPAEQAEEDMKRYEEEHRKQDSGGGRSQNTKKPSDRN